MPPYQHHNTTTRQSYTMKMVPRRELLVCPDDTPAVVTVGDGEDASNDHVRDDHASASRRRQALEEAQLRLHDERVRGEREDRGAEVEEPPPGPS